MKNKLNKSFVFFSKTSLVITGLSLIIAFFTPLPLKSLEFWAKLNGFEARGFSGRIWNHLKMAHVADENSKRRVELNNVDMTYRLLPHPRVDSIEIDQILMSRPKAQPLKFAKVFSGLLQVASVQMGLPTKQLQVGRVFVKEIKLKLFEDAPELSVSNLLLENVEFGPSGLFIGKLSAEGNTFKMSQDGLAIRIDLNIPKEYFEDINVNLDGKIVCLLGSTPNCSDLSLLKDSFTLKLAADGVLQQSGRLNIQQIAKSEAHAAAIAHDLNQKER